jgi:hypothetical protein
MVQLDRMRHAADNSGTQGLWMFTRTNQLPPCGRVVRPSARQRKIPVYDEQIFRISRSERFTSHAYYVPIHILTHLIPLQNTLILSFHLHLHLRSGFPRKSKNGILTDRLRVTWPAHKKISIYTSQKYLGNSTNAEAPLYVMFCSIMPLPPYRVSLLPSATYYRKYWFRNLCFVWDTRRKVTI